LSQTSALALVCTPGLNHSNLIAKVSYLWETVGLKQVDHLDSQDECWCRATISQIRKKQKKIVSKHNRHNREEGRGKQILASLADILFIVCGYDGEPYILYTLITTLPPIDNILFSLCTYHYGLR